MSVYETARADLAHRLVERDRLVSIHAANQPQRELLRTIHARKQHRARGVQRFTQAAVFHNFLHGIAAQELAACPQATGAVRADIEAEARHHAHLRDAAQTVKLWLQRKQDKEALAAQTVDLLRAALVLHTELLHTEQVRARVQHRALKRRRPPNCSSPVRRAALVGCAAAGAPPTVKATDNCAQLAHISRKVTDPM